MAEERRRILRRTAVMARVGLSYTTIWRLERKGKFPAHVQISENTIGWHEHDIDAFVESRRPRRDPIHPSPNPRATRTLAPEPTA